MKLRTLFVVCSVTLRELVIAEPVDYCRLSCTGDKNSGCDCFKGEDCPPLFDQSDLSSNERTYMVGTHNKYRKKVARGNEVMLWHVQVANMMALEYDEHLEHLAMCWAMKCKPGSDMCRRTPKFNRVGQNSYSARGACKGFESLFDAVKVWYASCIQKGTCFLKTDFNQLIWAKTTHVGCARVQMGTPTNACRIICNYGPREIYKPKSVFLAGSSGSMCPNFTKNVNGLCEAHNPLTPTKKSTASYLVIMWATHLMLLLSLLIL